MKISLLFKESVPLSVRSYCRQSLQTCGKVWQIWRPRQTVDELELLHDGSKDGHQDKEDQAKGENYDEVEGKGVADESEGKQYQEDVL